MCTDSISSITECTNIDLSVCLSRNWVFCYVITYFAAISTWWFLDICAYTHCRILSVYFSPTNRNVPTLHTSCIIAKLTHTQLIYLICDCIQRVGCWTQIENFLIFFSLHQIWMDERNLIRKFRILRKSKLHILTNSINKRTQSCTMYILAYIL